jgi:trigger factor
MNISFNNRDAVSGILKIEVTKEDYAAKVEASLRDIRRKANVPGFRKGMVPAGIIDKMYKKHVLVEEVNKLVSDNLFEYIRNNGIEMLGEPLPNETEQKEIDFSTDEAFEFCFDIALAPEVSRSFSKEDILTYYQVKVDDDMIGKQIEVYQATFGSYDDGAEEVEEKDMVKGLATELENGEPKAGGLVVEDAVLMPMYIKNEEEKSIMIGAAKGATLIFNPHKAYDGAEAEISSFLKTDKAKAADLTGDFSFEINEITRYKEAELNQELYDKAFGEGVVTDEEAFREKVRASIAEQYNAQSDRKFFIDARPLFLDKAKDMVLADDIIKRWLLTKEEYATMEEIEENYPGIFEDLKFLIVKESVAKSNISVKDEEVEDVARKMVKARFAQYGMYSLSDEAVSSYANNMLKDKEMLRNTIDRLTEDKLVDWLKNTVTMDIKYVSTEEFAEILHPVEQ